MLATVSRVKANFVWYSFGAVRHNYWHVTNTKVCAKKFACFTTWMDRKVTGGKNNRSNR